MNDHWILVADAGRARVFSTHDAGATLALIRELDHPAGRKRSQELVSDEAGRIDKGGRGILSAMDPPTDPHEHQARQFAETLTDLLDESHPFYARLTLVAPPHFLGLLMASLSKKTVNALAGSFPLDLTRLTPAEVSAHLRRAWRLN